MIPMIRRLPYHASAQIPEQNRSPAPWGSSRQNGNLAMKKLIRLGLTLTILAGSVTGCGGPSVDPARNHPELFAAMTPVPPEYRIGPGDSLSVIMPYNPELNYEGLVGPDGRFTMPVAGTVLVAGLTPSQAGDAIDAALIDNHTVRQAHSSVTIRGYAQTIYVGGEVKLPGAIPLRRSMDPLQAITGAGGLLDTARSDDVVLIRPGPDGKPILRSLNIDDLIHKGDATQAVALQPNDTIFVPKSDIANVDLWISQHIDQVLPFNRSFNFSINHDSNSTSTTQTQ